MMDLPLRRKSARLRLQLNSCEGKGIITERKDDTDLKSGFKKVKSCHLTVPLIVGIIYCFLHIYWNSVLLETPLDFDETHTFFDRDIEGLSTSKHCFIVNVMTEGRIGGMTEGRIGGVKSRIRRVLALSQANDGFSGRWVHNLCLSSIFNSFGRLRRETNAKRNLPLTRRDVSLDIMIQMEGDTHTFGVSTRKWLKRMSIIENASLDLFGVEDNPDHHLTRIMTTRKCDWASLIAIDSQNMVNADYFEKLLKSEKMVSKTAADITLHRSREHYQVHIGKESVHFGKIRILCEANLVKSKTDNQFSLGQAITMSAEKWLHQPTIEMLRNNERAELLIRKYNNMHVKVADLDFSGVHVLPYSTLQSRYENICNRTYLLDLIGEESAGLLMSAVHLEPKYLVHSTLDDEQDVSDMRLDLLPPLVEDADWDLMKVGLTSKSTVANTSFQEVVEAPDVRNILEKVSVNGTEYDLPHICLTVFGRWGDLNAALFSLRGYPKVTVVVMNESMLPSQLYEDFPDVRWLWAPRPGHLSSGWNLAFHINRDYESSIIVCNEDVFFPPDWLHRYVKAKAAFPNAKWMGLTQSIQFSGFELPVSSWQSVGPFDDTYRTYFEDDDYWQRLEECFGHDSRTTTIAEHLAPVIIHRRTGWHYNIDLSKKMNENRQFSERYHFDKWTKLSNMTKEEQIQACKPPTCCVKSRNFGLVFRNKVKELNSLDQSVCPYDRRRCHRVK